MARPDTFVLIPESTRKQKGAVPIPASVPGFEEGLPADAARRLRSLREEIRTAVAPTVADPARLMPAYLRYQGNMYRHIPLEAWEQRKARVDVLIVSGLYGVVASRDPVAYYECSMAESLHPLGKLNRWWHERGLPEILAALLRSASPRLVVDLLSLEYREAVAGFSDELSGIDVRTIDFPGMGRASQPLRGERVAEILRTGEL